MSRFKFSLTNRLEHCNNFYQPAVARRHYMNVCCTAVQDEC